MLTKSHSFDIETAIKYGVEKAILLQNLRFWLDKEFANKHRDQDDRSPKIQTHNNIKYVWTYNSASAFGELFPYFSTRSISRWLKELEQAGEIISGCFNKSAYDKTKWYTTPAHAIGDRSIGQIGVSNNQFGEPIPDINTNIKPISSPKKKKAKKKNELLDVFANEWYPDGIVPPRFWSKAATALSEIKEVEPDVTPERLREEIKAIRPQFTTSGPLAISGHWREYTQKKLKAKEDPLEIRYKALFSALIAFKQSGGEGLTVRQKEICAKITDYCTMRDLQLDKIMVDKEQLLGVYNEIIS